VSLRGAVVIHVSDSAQLMTVNQIFYDSQLTQPHRARITNLVSSSSTTFTIPGRPTNFEKFRNL